MILRSLTLEHFRGIRKAELTFEPTTILIGENDCGRTSVLDAIVLALRPVDGGAEFAFQPVHYFREAGVPAAPIRMKLSFVESQPDEWAGPGFQVLRRKLPRVLQSRRLFLSIEAKPEGVIWSIGSGEQEAACRNDKELLGWLRSKFPVFRLEGGLLGIGLRPTGSRKAGADPLAQLVEEHYRGLVEGTEANPLQGLERGYEAAKGLLEQGRSLFKNASSPLGGVLAEIAGKRKPRRSVKADDSLRIYGTAAQKVGILLLVGAFLRERGHGLDPDASPLLLIEEPEAHLHPMTLASVWSLMARLTGQKIVGTHSGYLLSSAPLAAVRRLTRNEGQVREWRVPEGALSADELRRYTYHMRSRRDAANLARCWLLVEGETEFWLLNELARVCGYEFGVEGIACVEFAQCGLGPLLKVARHLGLEWHLLADGDRAGQTYAEAARLFCAPGEECRRMSVLQDKDVEHCFWRYGYADVFRRAAYPGSVRTTKLPAKEVIARAVQRRSKPFMAVELLEAVAQRGVEGVPPPLRAAIETCVQLARTPR
jgi:putative ATP-dependent endonuclease of the OLD family